MNLLTCQEAQEQLDLLASGECPSPLRETLEQHLESCPTCAASYAESQRMLALLDLHWQERGLERLQERIEEEARRHRKKRRFLPPVLQRGIAVAATLLLMVGVFLLPSGNLDQGTREPTFALLVQRGQERPGAKPSPARGMDTSPELLQGHPEKIATGRQARKGSDTEVVVIVPAGKRTGQAFRDQLITSQREGKLPPPPAISLELALVNTGPRPVEVQLGDATSQLVLEVQGAGVVRLPAVMATEPDFLHPQKFQLAPGQRHVISITRLVAGTRGQLEYIYLTEPGDHPLTPRLRLTAAGQPVTVTGKTVLLRVR